MAGCRLEVHHRVPRCLLGFFDRFVAGDLAGEGLQAWFDWVRARGGVRVLRGRKEGEA